MTVSQTSRYRSAVIQTVTSEDGKTRQEMRVPFPRAIQFSYTFYRVTSADRVDTLADKFLGDGKLWWRIAEANPEVINWIDVQPGTVLRIPND